ncbi:helix-turn-helix domain-containing protein [Nocardia seriolae]|nr:helix-turn-helix transcriptional regulator [Nocardia seriolae]GEM27748.1 hypothetical protein NS2_59870 [Nocardia seriolae NBRC 15557]WKY56268.1 helix-turn-helix transcriptional regulator [Nocardia seriolae]WNJ63012.1 helix-turn-helix transcriptional regulator [Nocardia seriolae]BEK88200.1 hypothetical protein NSERKGN1266_41510 [Nocardia seriolae]BEK95864.1 hypothetical protein NSER024013_37700 [Nocardia seriolae]
MLRAAREAAGLGLREMARRTHFTASYLSLIETGRRPVTAEIVAAYEGTLGRMSTPPARLSVGSLVPGHDPGACPRSGSNDANHCPNGQRPRRV